MLIRVVLDANVYASALMTPNGIPDQVFKQILISDDHELVTSQPILDEIERVVFYPKVRKFIKKTDQELSHWLEALALASFIVAARFSHEVIVKEDPDDDKYLIAAKEANAGFLVSGDKHLLKIVEYLGIKIETPTIFLGRLLSKPVQNLFDGV